VASFIIEKIPEKINKVIFCGIPLANLTEPDKEQLKTALKKFPTEKIKCFQNIDDPYSGYEEVKNFLADINSGIEIISKERNDHHYPYYSEFRSFLKT
jgi:hypothetical protein